AFLELEDPAILRLMAAEGFGPVSDADYDVVRALERSVADYR
ncbi:MAG: phosphate ABC transporter substrate-binding protein, partial [Planctomycetota bacterium]